jgi:hypothetical protein
MNERENSPARDFLDAMGFGGDLTEEGRVLAERLGLDPDGPETAKDVTAFLMEQLAGRRAS